MKIKFQRFVALLLMFTAFLYSLNIHGLSHVFEDSHIDDNQHCELCIINHQKQQDTFALTPVSDSFNLNISLEIINPNISTELVQNTFQSLFLDGQLFNRPPPATV